MWTPFGGISAQFNQLAAILSLGTLESAGFPIRYRESAIRTLSVYARARFPFGFFDALSEVREDTRRTIADDGAMVDADFPESANPPNGKGQPRPHEGK